jgi:hypothetical protein
MWKEGKKEGRKEGRKEKGKTFEVHQPTYEQPTLIYYVSTMYQVLPMPQPFSILPSSHN